MALISCHECEKEVSTEAKQCPHCGASVKIPKPPTKPVGNGFKILLISVFVLAFIGAIVFQEEDKNTDYQKSFTKSTVNKDKDPKECIWIQDHTWTNDTLAKHSLTVKNNCDNAVKDVQFKFEYFGDSNTKVATGYETVYENFWPGDVKKVEVSEFSHSKAVNTKSSVEKAKWKWEEGESNLDW